MAQNLDYPNYHRSPQGSPFSFDLPARQATFLADMGDIDEQCLNLLKSCDILLSTSTDKDDVRRRDAFPDLANGPNQTVQFVSMNDSHEQGARDNSCVHI